MPSTKTIYSLLADAILLVHFAFVAFVVAGFALIWTGYLLRWSFVRNLRFRVIHLLAIGVVLAESLAGFICPLTTWENQLRIRAGKSAGYEGSFIQHWLDRLLFYEWSEVTFTIVYALFFLFVVVTFWVVRPRRQPRLQRD
jgi:Protein of Unknown function (DUF2784)